MKIALEYHFKIKDIKEQIFRVRPSDHMEIKIVDSDMSFFINGDVCLITKIELLEYFYQEVISLD